ncbi:MAG: AAA family ATPase [Anaerolineae bacterium]|nr:AAA family ATPase [Anaerolineae bacterium]
MEALPKEFSVIGVNDYLFLDGYKRLLKEKMENDRIPNIDLLLPVIEFRIAKFSGVEFRNTKRINIHVIFAEDVTPTLIEGQFLNGLSQGYKLEPGLGGAAWDGLISKESLVDFGKSIKSTVPPEKLKDYGSDLIEGFNNLNFDEDKIIERLRESTYFRGKFLIAIGNTEWNDLDWSDGSIAEKKNIINKADIVFVASESISKFDAAKAKLTAQKVNDLLLDCSDAHHFSHETETKDRIGNSYTWVKADPSFHGLQQVINEPNQRLYVGEIPPLLDRVNQRPSRFASKLRVWKSPTSSAAETWFDQEVQLNPGLIAVIGKKGSGKSALADIVALLGNTHRFDDFSFLSKKRFRDHKLGLADQFEAELDWVSGYKSGPMLLSVDPDINEIEGVDYIPQSFLDRICNEIAEGQSNRFYSELQEVIFSHIPKSGRFGCDSLAQLVELQTEEREAAINLLVVSLAKVNKNIVDLEIRLEPENRDRLLKKYVSLTDDIRTARQQVRPHKVVRPAAEAGSDDEAQKIIERLDSLKLVLSSKTKFKRRVEAIRDHHSLRLTNLNKLRGRIKNLVDQHASAMIDVAELGEKLGLDPAKLVNLNVNLGAIDAAESISSDLVHRSTAVLEDDADGAVSSRLSEIKNDIEQEKKKLTEPQQRYEAYVQATSAWRGEILSLIGSEDDPETARGVKYLLKELDRLPDELVQLKEDRLGVLADIFAEKELLKTAYEKLHVPVQKFIDQHTGMDTENELTFTVSVQDTGFLERFFGFIHKGRIGSFSGQREGAARLQVILDNADLESIEGVSAFLDEINLHLNNDMRLDSPQHVQLADQLLDGIGRQDVYDFIYGLSYLKPEFEIGWAGKNLNQLSPGEKGTLLLIFYLLVDRSDRPLIIDQPEENLDNETVFKTLVPCVKEARKRRQVILITHNPNLAVVCDADQIIHASIDKADGNRITYTSGSIENPAINQLLVDVLEGTRPAFNARDSKYEVSR